MFKGHAILPSTSFVSNEGKAKATLKECIDFWGPTGTIVVCVKPNGQFHFIAGASGNYHKAGDKFECYHDQTGSQFAGPWTCVNEIYYDAKAGTTTYQVDPVEGVNVPKNMAAPAACFK